MLASSYFITQSFSPDEPTTSMLGHFFEAPTLTRAVRHHLRSAIDRAVRIEPDSHRSDGTKCVRSRWRRPSRLPAFL
jgi:hypothetical protein